MPDRPEEILSHFRLTHPHPSKTRILHSTPQGAVTKWFPATSHGEAIHIASLQWQKIDHRSIPSPNPGRRGGRAEQDLSTTPHSPVLLRPSPGQPVPSQRTGSGIPKKLERVYYKRSTRISQFRRGMPLAALPLPLPTPKLSEPVSRHASGQANDQTREIVPRAKKRPACLHDLIKGCPIADSNLGSHVADRPAHTAPSLPPFHAIPSTLEHPTPPHSTARASCAQHLT